MAQLKYHPFAGRQPGQHRLDSFADFPAQEAALGIRLPSRVGDRGEPVDRSVFAFDRGRLGPPNPSAPQEIDAQVVDDAIQPGLKAAVETERPEVTVDPQKRLLIDVVGVILGAKHVHGNPQNTAVVLPDQPLECIVIAGLRRANQRLFIHRAPDRQAASQVRGHDGPGQRWVDGHVFLAGGSPRRI